MKKIWKVIVLILFIIIFTFIIAFMFLKFFNVKNPAIISNLKVTVEENAQKIENNANYLQYYNSYEFKVNNTNKLDVDYEILIKDNSNKPNSIERKYINYILYMNNKIIHSGELSDIKNDILDTRTINAGQINNYKLEVWTDEYDVNNKSYEYSIKIKEAGGNK